MALYNQVNKGDEVKRTTNVDKDGMKVVKHHVTAHGKGDSATLHEMTWTFDFSGCSQEQILELASRDAVIKARPAFRDIPQKDIEKWDGKVFDVADMLARERKSLPPLEKAQKAVQGLSEDEKAELLKALQGQLEK